MEIWDAYDSEGNKLNRELIRGERIPEGLHHLVCEVLVRHIDGDYLLMKRDERKPNHPGAWEASAGGSALKGEEPLACAQRELYEETGLRAERFTQLNRRVNHDTIYFEYVCQVACDKQSVRLQAGETVAFRWVSGQALEEMLANGQLVPSSARRLRLDAT